jgi:hypothetical protein
MNWVSRGIPAAKLKDPVEGLSDELQMKCLPIVNVWSASRTESAPTAAFALPPHVPKQANVVCTAALDPDAPEYNRSWFATL